MIEKACSLDATIQLRTSVDEQRAFLPVQGKVVENGSHAELLARGGKYAELWARQVRKNLDTLHPWS